MKSNDRGSVVGYGLTAVFAGALGSFLTLLSMGYLNGAGSEKLPIESGIQYSASDGDLKPSQTANPISKLLAELESAKQERLQLSTSVLDLTRELQEYEQRVQLLEDVSSESSEALASNSGALISEGNVEGRIGRAGGRQPQISAQQRVQNLVAAGVDPQTANDLQARRDEFQLARLELLDQASREGWADSEQLTEKLSELDENRVNLQEELGDDAYDRYLFESGIPNRVSIASVIPGSAANVAGLKVGDMLISYDYDRVYRVNTIQQATRAGVKGEYVQIQFYRDGSLLSADLPRGPLGVTLSMRSVEP